MNIKTIESILTPWTGAHQVDKAKATKRHMKGK